MTFLWVKLLGFLKLTKKFGLLIKIIEYMIVDLISFFVIMVIIILAFATVFWNAFTDSNDDYKNLYKTILTLITTMYGQVGFDHFYQNATLGSIFVNIYSIVTIILLLNLLIAILTNTFDKVN